MTDAVLAQHTPALKVGGRRLSVSSKPKPHATAEPSPTSATDRDPVDYPRPAPPGADADARPHAPPHTEEDVPKKEKKHGQGGHDERKQRDVVRRMEATRPTRETGGGRSGFGAAGRIAQPVGKMFI